MIRRFGEPVRSDIRYTLRPGAYAILFDGRDILLTSQNAPEPEIQLPGGGIDPGEASVPALHREVMEETGWTISDPVRMGAYRRFVFMPEYDLWAEKMVIIYLARPCLRKTTDLEDGHAALWMSPREAHRDLTNEGDRFFLGQVLGL